jgi:hypothetical protein
MGIEPTSEGWEALNKTLKVVELVALSFRATALLETKWKLRAAADCGCLLRTKSLDEDDALQRRRLAQA